MISRQGSEIDRINRIDITDFKIYRDSPYFRTRYGINRNANVHSDYPLIKIRGRKQSTQNVRTMNTIVRTIKCTNNKNVRTKECTNRFHRLSIVLVVLHSFAFVQSVSILARRDPHLHCTGQIWEGKWE